MYSRLMRAFVAVVAATSFAAVTAGAQPSAFSPWSDVSPFAIDTAGDRVIEPLAFRVLSADLDALTAYLATAPLEGTPAASSRAEIALPLPDGTNGRFSIVEAPVMHPELQARYPEIRTYAGYGLDDGTATVRLDVTPHGFHALILSADGTVYIDPYQRGDVTHYQSYWKRDFVSEKSFGCTVVDEDGMAEQIREWVGSGAIASGTQLRTYRLAVGTTGEYSTYHGGTVPLALAAVVTSVNRVTGVYEREVSCRLQLVPTETSIIYLDPATDPYTNGSGSAMLGQNQSTCDSVIGSANYDIGHAFSTGAGGIAYVGVVCRTGIKAGGVTGTSAPVGDPYDIDYVAHEMGHQFGGNHTFNGTAGACSGSRVASAAYEPGSGSTIMAYAGICAFHNLQPHSDDYFHWKSIAEIVAYTTGGSGSTCPVTTPTGAIEPSPSAPAGGFSIPIDTPFSLTGSAVTTGSPTYCWEESDLGPAGGPDVPSGNAPIFRSFNPTTTPTRIFPKLTDILNNTHTRGELLPGYARNLSFKMTVRDFQAGGVGVANASIAFSVAGVGPFLVTYPNTAVSWTPNTSETITWDVASTDLAPINCSHVSIQLSTDGGYTWTVLLAATPNDGSQAITVPATPTTEARIKVEAVGNIFFDLSNEDFEITAATGVPALVTAPSGLTLYGSRPNPFRLRTEIEFEMPQAGQAAIRVFDPAGRLVRTIAQGERAAGRHRVIWDGTDAAGLSVSSGVYFYRLDAMNETLTGRLTLMR